MCYVRIPRASPHRDIHTDLVQEQVEKKGRYVCTCTEYLGTKHGKVKRDLGPGGHRLREYGVRNECKNRQISFDPLFPSYRSAATVPLSFFFPQ